MQKNMNFRISQPQLIGHIVSVNHQYFEDDDVVAPQKIHTQKNILMK